MGIKTLIFPSCKQLAERYSSGRYERAPWYERLGVRLHLVRCDLCRVYAKQMGMIGDAFRASCAKKGEAPPSLKRKLRDRLR